MAEKSEKVYSVSELTRRIRGTLEHAFGQVWVEGELSNVRRPASGHYYLTIKDENSQISAVLFKRDQAGLTFEPADGVQVRAWGGVSVYEARGTYQIIVRKLEESGQGALQQRFEALKRKLQAEGLFDPARKRPLPMLPQRIGVVTSDTGAAIRDILNVVTRRFPNLHVVLAPAKVQGVGAAAEIVAGIEALNAFGGLDAMIVGRGGGSLEDLWCFNEEIVARAIAASRIPVISAVGHEIDFTISDFVADMRAPTPSAAAELVVGCKDAFEERLRMRSDQLANLLSTALLRARTRFERVRGSSVFQRPAAVVAAHRSGLERARMCMEHRLTGRVMESRQRIDDAAGRLTYGGRLRCQRARQDLARLGGQLRVLDPRGVLSRGYTLTRDAKGRVIRRAVDVSKGMELVTEFADGKVSSVVSSAAAPPVAHKRRRRGESDMGQSEALELDLGV